MKNQVRWLGSGASFFLGLSLLLLSDWSSFGVIRDITYTHKGKTHAVGALPWSAPLKGRIDVAFTLEIDPGVNAFARVTPDDTLLEMRVNGTTVDLAEIAPEPLSAGGELFSVDLGEYLVSGQNRISMRLENEHYRGGLDFQMLGWGAWGRSSNLVHVLGFVMCVSALVLLLDLSTFSRLILVLSAALMAHYNTVTPHLVRGYDAKVHVEYIEHVLANRELPRPGSGRAGLPSYSAAGWESHQPPLYYLSSALGLALVRKVSFVRDFLWLQMFSMVGYLFFLVWGLKSIARAPMTRSARRWAGAVLCFWPVGFIHAARVGNDSWYYAFSAATFYFFLRWWQRENRTDALWFCCFLSLTLMTKTTGLVWLPVLVCVLPFKAWPRPFPFRSWAKPILVGVAVVGVGLAVNLADNVWYWLRGGSSLLLGSADAVDLFPGFVVGNQVRNYLIFDVVKFLRFPFVSIWDDALGRQWFWNYLLKTSLFGEFSVSGAWHEFWALVSAPCLLILCLFALRSLWDVVRSRSLVHIPWMAFGAGQLAALLAFRISAPLSVHTDFRFVLPALLAFVYLLGLGLSSYGVRTKFFLASVSAVFIGAGVMFFVSIA